jgi:hypothetical protein
MPTYKVIITRDITESTVVEVEAKNEEEADEVAHQKLSESMDTKWEVDDGSWNNGQQYTTGISIET